MNSNNHLGVQRFTVGASLCNAIGSFCAIPTRSESFGLLPALLDNPCFRIFYACLAHLGAYLCFKPVLMQPPRQKCAGVCRKFEEFRNFCARKKISNWYVVSRIKSNERPLRFCCRWYA